MKALFGCWASATMRLKDHTRYVGGSQGLSIRLIKGLYYRTGAFAGHKITEQGIEFHLGDLTITNKVMFFVDFAGTTIVRIDIPKIVAMESYADGFKVVMGGAKPKPFTFMADVQDICFASNVISRITQSAYAATVRMTPGRLSLFLPPVKAGLIGR